MSDEPPPGPTASAPSLASAARWVVILAGTFFLLRELGPILKPLLLAVLLAYVILPFHFAVKKRVPGRLSLAVSIILSLVLLSLLTLGIQASVRTLNSEMPAFVDKTRELQSEFLTFAEARFPFTTKSLKEMASGDSDTAIRELTNWLVAVAASTLSTAAVVGLYLLFLLLEASRFPSRVQKSFTGRRAERIMETIEGINRAIAHYLNAKVKASLLLAVPIFIILVVFGTRFALIWAVLVFFCNFIPYLGSVVGYCVPTLFVLIQFGYGWEFITIASVMLAMHLTTASVIEPAVIGKAVGLSPVVILFALAFWGSIWGLTGMLLAVPLTVMMKIVAGHMDATKPVAKLLGED